MPYLKARDGESVYVRVVGRGAPCLLLHGFASDSSSWLPFVAPLSHRFRFYMPDLRGFGASRKAPLRHVCPLTTYAEDLEDILDQLALPSLSVAGISMGAFTALSSFRLFGGARYARYMHIDQGLVIRNTSAYRHGLLGERQDLFFGRMSSALDRIEGELRERGALEYDALPAQLRQDFAQIFGDFALAAFGRPPLRAALRPLLGWEPLIRRLMPPEGLQTYVQIMRAYLEQNYDLRPAFSALKVPTTVLIGGASRMYPAEGQRSTAKLLPHAAVRELPGIGHVIPVEAPLRFVSELNAFLSA
ncbi:MAG: alpha/beta hydrolase [Myxococcales bacterium]